MCIQAKRPVEFLCSCGTKWFAPPDSGCPQCGHDGISEAEPYVYELHEVIPGLWITGHMKSEERFLDLVMEARPEVIVDLAGDHHYIWRPSDEQLALHGVRLQRIDDVVDDGNPFSHDALDVFRQMMAPHEVSGARTIVHCAAGLRRAPHFVYAYLRYRGWEPVDAWDLVERARSRIYMHTPYINSVESWLSTSHT